MTTKAELIAHLGILGTSIPCSYNGNAATLAHNGMAVFEGAILQQFGVTFDDTGKPAGLLMVGRPGVGRIEIPVFFP